MHGKTRGVLLAILAMPFLFSRGNGGGGTNGDGRGCDQPGTCYQQPDWNAATGTTTNDVLWNFFAAHPKPPVRSP